MYSTGALGGGGGVQAVLACLLCLFLLSLFLLVLDIHMYICTHVDVGSSKLSDTKVYSTQ